MKPQLNVVVAFFCLWIVIIVVRLYNVQVVRGEYYAEKAKRQQDRLVELEGTRGRILDLHGRLLATSLLADSVFAEPRLIKNPQATARLLVSRIPGLDSSSLESRLKSGREFVWVSRKLDPPIAESVRELNLSGISFLPEPKRYYPMRDQASQILGFVGMDHKGIAGLELFYERKLVGETILSILHRDARRGTIVPPSFREPKSGQDVRLTLDASVQSLVEDLLARAVEHSHARSASAILLSPSDGAILAMATYPGFDLNHPSEYSSDRQRISLARDIYHPGSLFLVAAAAASVDLGFLDWNEFAGFGSNSDIRSSASVLERVAYDHALYPKLRELGFGSLTRIDVPGERGGMIEIPKVGAGDRGRASGPFSGLAVTPLQMVTALTALANGGFLVQPHLAQRPLGPPIRVFSGSTSSKFRRFWHEETMRGRSSGLPRNVYRRAGLAGRFIGPLDGPNEATTIDVYFGFAPISAPKFSGLILIDGVSNGVEVHGLASSLFAEIAYQGLRCLRVSPEPRPNELWPGQRSRR